MHNIPNTENFVRLFSYFSSKKDRTVEKLSSIYKDSNKLKEAFEVLFDKKFLNSIYGKKILIKPNWVRHSINDSDNICLRANNDLLLAILDILLKQNPKEIVVGDAPLNTCDWEQMITPSFVDKINKLGKNHNITISIVDFRRVTFNTKLNKQKKDRRSLSNYTIFDLEKKSFLEPISKKSNSGFRVTNYNPDRLKESHKLGTHKYCITNDLFESDIIISIPKIKTHEKTGITCALKNLVGINGDKDFLPHHRVGGIGLGGDCYPGMNILRRFSEYFRDQANRNIGSKPYPIWIRLSDILWKLSNPKNVHQIAAAWYGNDTTWRMVMDLNLIALFGKKDGTISNNPQRNIFTITDGIIGGQGNGPLHPSPLPFGFLAFSNSSTLNDICMAHLMGFNLKKLPLLINARESFLKDLYTITVNGNSIREADLSKYSIKTTPSDGWKNHL